MRLSFETDFPGGNGLLLCADESGGRPVVRFAAEPKNCPQALWFHFRLTGLAGRGARVVLANPEQTLGGWDWSADRLVWCGRRTWTRSGAAEPIDAPGGRIEWAWDIAADADELDVAFCYPYQLAELEQTLRDVAGAFESTTIGVTAAGRELPRVFSRVPDEGGPPPDFDALREAVPPSEVGLSLEKPGEQA